MNEQACTDIGRNIAEKMQDLLQREVRIAQHVLNGQELSYVMMRMAVSLTGGVITAALQTRNGVSTPDHVWDQFASAIHEGVLAIKPEYLAKLREIEAERTGAVA